MKTVSTVAAATKRARTVCPPRARYASSGPYEERGDPVGAQPHPGEEGDEGDVVEDLRVEEVPGSPEQNTLHALVDRDPPHHFR